VHIMCTSPYHDMCQYFFFMSLLFIMMSPLTIYCIHSSLPSHIYNTQIHHPHRNLKTMKITLLLTILGVSANTAVSAFDLPQFLRGNNACECQYDNECNGNNSWCDQDVNCSGDEFGNDGGFCVYENDNADECNNKNDCNNDEFCDNQGYCRRRFNGDRGNDRGVCDYKQCTKKSNQDLCQCNLNNSRCAKGSEPGANTCSFNEDSNMNGCCVPGAGANMFLADEIQDQDFGEEE